MSWEEARKNEAELNEADWAHAGETAGKLAQAVKDDELLEAVADLGWTTIAFTLQWFEAEAVTRELTEDEKTAWFHLLDVQAAEDENGGEEL